HRDIICSSSFLSYRTDHLPLHSFPTRRSSDLEKKAFILDVRQYPGRQPEEPDTERVVRGARDGYTENVVFNTALTRMRIRDERLRNEMVKVGERSKSDVCISYLQDVADNELVE